MVSTKHLLFQRRYLNVWSDKSPYEPISPRKQKVTKETLPNGLKGKKELKLIKTILSAAVFAAFFACGSLKAEPISVVMTVNVYAKYLYALGSYDPTFIPQNI